MPEGISATIAAERFLWELSVLVRVCLQAIRAQARVNSYESRKASFENQKPEKSILCSLSQLETRNSKLETRYSLLCRTARAVARIACRHTLKGTEISCGDPDKT